jgi:phage terminase large subunit
MDTMFVASQAALNIDRWKPDATFIDQGGVGGGVVDRLMPLGHHVIGIDFGGAALDPRRFINRRAEMWWSLADWIRAGGCLPDEPELGRELTAPTYRFDPHGRIQLESKDEIKKRLGFSPDLADAYALTFAAPVHPRAHRGGSAGVRVHRSVNC